MPDILHDFPIHAPIDRVFEAISTSGGLDQWWTKRSAGTAAPGAEYQLWFGPEYDWRGVLCKCSPPAELEYRMVRADEILFALPDQRPEDEALELDYGELGVRVTKPSSGWGRR